MPCKVKRDKWRQVDSIMSQSYGGPVQTVLIDRSWAFDESRTCTDNPKYKEMIKNHVNATGYYKVTARGGRGQTGNVKAFTVDGTSKYWYNGIGHFHDCVIHSVSDNRPPVGDSYFLAQSKFINNVNKAQRGALTGCFAVEGVKTLKMIRSPAKALFEGVQSFLGDAVSSSICRRGHRRCRISRVKYEENLSNLWLEYTMGWSPLIGDIQGLAEQYASAALGTRLIPVSAFASKEASVAEVETGVIPYAGTFQRNVTYTNRQMTKIRGKVMLKSGTSWENNVQALGLDLNSFVPTVWELIPWSFLVDYFLNISEILDAWSFSSAGLTWTSVAKLKTTERKSVGYGLTAKKGWSVTGSLGSMNSYVKTFERNSFVVQIPPLELSMPGSPMKFLNMAALATVNKDALKKVQRNILS